MEIDKKLIPMLSKIDFANRYLLICKTYPYLDNSKTCFACDKQVLFDTIKFCNTKFKYMKNEKFFMLKESISSFDFQFNIIVRSEVIQLVLDLKQNNERLKLGWGMWESIVSELINKDFEVKPRPCFYSYDELKEILKEAFAIYEDFKREVIKEYGKENV